MRSVAVKPVTMKVAGIGFRDRAGLASVLDALDRAGAAGVTRLALPARKAGHPLSLMLTRQGYELVWIADRALAEVETPTQSTASMERFSTGSVCEAAALAALGPGARLAAGRSVSADRLATAALAFTGEPA